MNLFFSKMWVALIKKLYHCPLSWRDSMASVAAKLLWWAIPKRRKVILTNLRLCFPEMSDQEREALAHQVYHRLARAALDHGVLWEGTKEELREFVTFEGLENFMNELQRALL